MGPELAKTEDYILGRQLGEGMDGVVRVCTHRATGRVCAVKSVPRSEAGAARRAAGEIAFLERLGAGGGHPNIVPYRGSWADDTSVHVLTELCGRGDLREYIHRHGPLPEAAASEVTSALAAALVFCHGRGIVHRDVKPENILLVSPPDITRTDPVPIPAHTVKLADFGSAADLSGKYPELSGRDRYGFFREAEGTAPYLAPEVLSGCGYDEMVDVWSLGVLLYVMLSGYAPFTGQDIGHLFLAIRWGRLDLKKEPWPCISQDAKSLLKAMLQRNPYRRMKLRDLLMHPWLNMKKETSSSSSSSFSSTTSSTTSSSSSSLSLLTFTAAT